MMFEQDLPALLALRAAVPALPALTLRLNLLRRLEPGFPIQKQNPPAGQVLFLVGATGFEPATFCSQSRRSTRLSHAPKPF